MKAARQAVLHALEWVDAHAPKAGAYDEAFANVVSGGLMTTPAALALTDVSKSVCMGKSHIGVHTKSTLAVATTPAALALTDTSRSIGIGKSHIGVYTKSTLAPTWGASWRGRTARRVEVSQKLVLS